MILLPLRWKRELRVPMFVYVNINIGKLLQVFIFLKTPSKIMSCFLDKIDGRRYFWTLNMALQYIQDTCKTGSAKHYQGK